MLKLFVKVGVFAYVFIQNGELMTVSEDVDGDDSAGATRGSFSGFTVSSLMQMVEADLRSCSVQICGEGLQRGALIFAAGDPYSASCGRLRGDDAILEMIGWDAVDVVFLRMPGKFPVKTVSSSTMALIMEGMRLKDERLAEQDEAGIKVGNSSEGKDIMAGLEQMMQDIAGEVDGVIAVGVFGLDGSTVAVHNPSGADMAVVSAKFAMVMKLVKRTVEDLENIGDFEENLVQTANAWILTRFLDKEYYLAFIVSREGTLGNVRLVAKKYLAQVQHAL